MPKGKAGPKPGPKAPKKERKRGAKQTPEAETKKAKPAAAASPPTPAAGDNQPGKLTAAQRQSLTFQHLSTYERLDKVLKKAQQDMRQFGKEVKADLGKRGLEDIKTIIRVRDGGDAEESVFKSDVERMIEMARWLDMPVGFEGDLFEDIDRRDAAEKGETEGWNACMAGNARKAPYDPVTRQAQGWYLGFDKAQEELAKGFKKLEPEAKSAEPARGEIDALADKAPEPPPTNGTTETKPTNVVSITGQTAH